MTSNQKDHLPLYIFSIVSPFTAHQKAVFLYSFRLL